MKILKNILLLILSMGLASCAVGPTARLADGTFVTLGADVATKSVSDARTATLPNGTKLGWARNGADYTGPLHDYLTITQPAKYLLNGLQSNNGVKIVKSNNGAKVDMNGQNTAADLGKAGIKGQTDTTGAAIGAGAPLGQVNVVPPGTK